MTKISGDRDTVFGYTGHFWHAASGLDLAMYRAYDPNLGRWISRDPILASTTILNAGVTEGNQGPGLIRAIDTPELIPDGMLLYGYVSNDPINKSDILGLTCIRYFGSKTLKATTSFTGVEFWKTETTGAWREWFDKPQKEIVDVYKRYTYIFNLWLDTEHYLCWDCEGKFFTKTTESYENEDRKEWTGVMLTNWRYTDAPPPTPPGM